MPATLAVDAPPAPLRVLVADDHNAIRRGLTILLDREHDIDVVGEAVNGREAIRLAEELKPSVILMDLAMPEVDGIAATKEILAKLPDTKILIVSSEEDPAAVNAALASGASGYLPKSSYLLEAPNAVRELHWGKRFIRETKAWMRLRTTQG